MRANIGLSLIDTDILGLGIPGSHLPKGILNDTGGVHPHLQLQVKNGALPVPPDKVIIPPGGSVPPVVLGKPAPAPMRPESA